MARYNKKGKQKISVWSMSVSLVLLVGIVSGTMLTQRKHYLKTRAVDISAQTVTFDELPGNTQLNGQYPIGIIDWGVNTWGINVPSGLLNTPNLEYNSKGIKNASFSFLVPRRLVSFTALNRANKAATVKISCPGQTGRMILAQPNTLTTIYTGWTANCSPVYIASSNGYNTVFDNLAIDEVISSTPSLLPAVPTTTPISTAVPSATKAPLTSPIPTLVPVNSGWWVPPQRMTWQWMIDHPLDINNSKDMGYTSPTGAILSYPNPEMYDIDGFYNGRDPNCNIKDKNGVCVTGTNNAVNQLHLMGKKVVCYIDTGVYENYREDAYKFPAAVIGNQDSGWNGSNWLDIRRTDILWPIMEARIKMCKDKGYDSIEPDEMVNYSNNSGFPLTYQDQLKYNKGIAALAHKYNISIALKDDPEQAVDLVNDFDWMINEECYQYQECNLLNPFSQAGKAVMDIEYKVAASIFCADSNYRNWNSMQMPLNLDGGRVPCR